MDYSKLSDRDIDALVLQTIYGNQGNDKDIMRSWLRGGFKYTTNPADAWPIIKSNRIALSPLFGGEWRASVDDECGFISYTCSTENPLRAAMTVFIMLQESANVQDNPA